MNFYSLSSMLWSTFQPVQALVYLLLLVLILSFFNKNKFSRIINSITIILFILVILLPNGTYLLWKLENAYTIPKSFPNKIDGILILGGGINPILTYEHSQTILNEKIERIIESVKLIKQFPDAKVIYSEGAPITAKINITNIDAVKFFYKQMGVNNKKIIFENKSRNTYENIIFSKKFINENDSNKWILLTSAYHMKRAMSVAAKLELNFIPYPVDYRLQTAYNWKLVYIVKGRTFLTNLNHFQLAIHEYIGLIVYYLTKKSNKII